MKHLIIVLSLIGFILSCQKEESNPIINNPESAIDYCPMANGNYWIYEVYYGDSSLTFGNPVNIDSVYVQKDSICNNNNYKVIKGNSLIYEIIRDSSNYLVSHKGERLFSLNKEDELLSEYFVPNTNEDVFISWSMKSQDSIFISKNNSFVCKYVLGTVKVVNPNISHLYNDRIIFRAYSKNIGIVAQRFTYAYANAYIEYRLIRYNVQTKK